MPQHFINSTIGLRKYDNFFHVCIYRKNSANAFLFLEFKTLIVKNMQFVLVNMLKMKTKNGSKDKNNKETGMIKYKDEVLDTMWQQGKWAKKML